MQKLIVILTSTETAVIATAKVICCFLVLPEVRFLNPRPEGCLFVSRNLALLLCEHIAVAWEDEPAARRACRRFCWGPGPPRR
jgi:hypothetical protein